MEAFIERFYSEVDDNLADPHSQKRLTRSQRLRDLHVVQKRIFERLLNATGGESSLGRTEISFVMAQGQARYPLPAGFRQFIGLEKRRGSDPVLVEGRLRSIDTYSSAAGVEILDGQRGCLIRPTPGAEWAGTWTLIYRKGPVRLHYATVADGDIDVDSLKLGTPGTDAGEVVKLADYYAGCLVRIVSATTGGSQITECVGNTVVGSTVTLSLWPEFNPKPQGSVIYEICPELPEHLDSIYAMDVALLNAGRRANIRRRAGLAVERSELWQACRNYFLSNVSDRAPSRQVAPQPDSDDPYD
jgi:hypothetical protein